MDIPMWVIYLIGQVENIIGVSSVVAILSGACAAFAIMIAFNSEENDKKLRVPKNISIILTIVFGTLAVFLPGPKTITAMILLPPILGNEQVQAIPENLVGYLNSWLKENTQQLEKELLK